MWQEVGELLTVHMSASEKQVRNVLRLHSILQADEIEARIQLSDYSEAQRMAGEFVHSAVTFAAADPEDDRPRPTLHARLSGWCSLKSSRSMRCFEFPPDGSVTLRAKSAGEHTQEFDLWDVRKSSPIFDAV